MAISLSKLDLSFLRKNDADGVQCGRFRYDTEEGVVPADYHAKKHRKPNKRSPLGCPSFMQDVDAAYGGAWKSVIDGSVISSRSNWREHNKRNDVVNVDRDFWGKDDTVERNKARMGYDPSLIGNSETFSWVDPS